MREKPEGSGATATPKPKAAKPGVKKPPKPEAQPFEAFIPNLLMPAIAQACEARCGAQPRLELREQPMPVLDYPCWQVLGELPGARRFWLCFMEPEINSRKILSLAEAGGDPSLLEPFLVDEKRVSLALLVARLVQRLEAQKWLGPN